MDMVIFLEGILVKINACEENAKKALANGNNGAYIEEMHIKAETLANLSTDIKDYDANMLSSQAQQFIAESINAFSVSAKRAIQLKSSWYMSQLLFDEDYKEGELNNFGLFLEELKEMN